MSDGKSSERKGETCPTCHQQVDAPKYGPVEVQRAPEGAVSRIEETNACGEEKSNGCPLPVGHLGVCNPFGHRGDTAGAGEPTGRCCEGGNFGEPHECRKSPAKAESRETAGEPALASGVTEPGALEQQAWNLYYDRHAKVAEEIVESLMIFAAPLRERVAELGRELESIADFANGEGDVGNIIARRARAALSPDSQDGKKAGEV